MIAKDQPTNFPAGLIVTLSSRNDGTMLNRAQGHQATDAVDNRRRFTLGSGVEYDNVVYQQIVYDDDQSYDRIADVDRMMTTRHCSHVAADALFTKQLDVGLLLAIADCTAMVIYDPVKRCLALLHLGRHSTVAGLTSVVIGKFQREGSRPEDLLVWMSPGAKCETYKMEWFDQREDPAWRDFINETDDGVCLDLPGFNAAVCTAAGIPLGNIVISPINTMTSTDYFSHANGDMTGRFAVVAMMQ